jgi:aminotransferase EvaB
MRVPLNDLSRSKTLTGEFAASLFGLLATGNYISGPKVAEFAKVFAQTFDLGLVTALANGTSALTIALKSLLLPKGSHVIIAANAGGYGRVAIEAVNLKAIYVDVNELGLLDLDTISRTDLTEVRAVIVTHLYGQLCEMESIKDFCRRKNIFLIEDCAQAVGAKANGNYAGSWGDLSTFSFYPTKNLGAMGDAGAIATKSTDLDQRIKMLSQYGWGKKYFSEIPNGENSRMDEIQAMVLLERLPYLAALNSRRREIWQRYSSCLDKPFRILGENSESFVAHLAIIDAGDKRQQFRDFLHERQIETSIHYPMPDYSQGAFLDSGQSLPKTKSLCDSIFTVPLFPELREDEIQYICDAISDFQLQISN